MSLAHPIVRPAVPDDLEHVIGIGHAAWRATYTEIAGREYVEAGLARWWSPELTATSIAQGRVLVAELDGRLVGMASYSVTDGVLDLWKLYVLPEVHRAGVGSALLHALLHGPAHGRTVRLAHMDGNVDARAFYDRHGFVETHRDADQLGGPDNVWMERAPTAR